MCVCIFLEGFSYLLNVCIRENGCNRFCSLSHNQISKDAQVLVIGNHLHSYTVLVNTLLDEQSHTKLWI